MSPPLRSGGFVPRPTHGRDRDESPIPNPESLILNH